MWSSLQPCVIQPATLTRFAANFDGYDVDVACRAEAGWFGLPQATYARFLSAGGAVPANGPLGADPRKNVQANWTLNVEPY